MFIENLDISGFGRLRGEFQFSRALTVVTGPNEAGKSTLHRALVTSLFGFSASERRRRQGRSSLLSRLGPWQGPPYGIRASLSTDSSSLLATWTFDAEDSSQALTLINNATGDDLTAEVAQRRGNYALGRYLMELDYDEFCQVCMLEQAVIGGVKRSDPLVEELRRAVEVGASEHGVDRAVDLLNAALGSDSIGVRRDNLSAKSNGRLGRSQTRMEEIHSLLDDAELSQRRLEELFRELEREHGREVSIRQQRDEATQQLLRLKFRDLDERVTRATTAMQTVEPESAGQVLEQTVIDQVKALFAQRHQLTARVDAGQAAANAAQSAVASIENESVGVREQLRNLEPYRVVDHSREARVREQLARLEEVDRAPAPTADSQPGTDQDQNLLPIAVGIAVASIAAAVLVSPAALVGLLVAGWLGWMALRPSTPVPAGTFDPNRVQQLSRELTSELDDAGATPAPDLKVRALGYLDGCEKRREFDQLSAREEEFRRRVLEVVEPAKEQQRLQEELASVHQELQAELESLEIEHSDLAAAERAFTRAVEEAVESQRARARAEGAEEMLDAALGGKTLEELTSDRDEARTLLDQHVATHSECPPRDGSDADLEVEVSDLGNELEALAKNLGRINGEIETREGELGPVPSLREELASHEESVAWIKSAANAIATARTALREAASDAHQRFAPLLNEAVAQDLPTITSGRYKVARINEELEMTLETPETGNPVDVSELSRGTQDQIFLIQRLAILGMLVPSDATPPLLLDDVFVHFDQERTRFGLEVLARESEQRQIVLFAGDPDIAETLTAIGVEHERIELDGPT